MTGVLTVLFALLALWYPPPEQPILATCAPGAEPVAAMLLPFNTDLIIVNDAPTIDLVANMPGERADWNSQDGLVVEGRLHARFYLILLLADGQARYALVYTASREQDYFAFATDSLRRFVADYGGAYSWHGACGAWRIKSEHVQAVLDRFEAIRDVQAE